MSACELTKVRGLGGEFDPAAALEVALDGFAVNDPLDRIHRGVVSPVEGSGSFESEALYQASEVMRQPVVALSAVSTRCFTDDTPGFEHYHRCTPPRQSKCRGQSGQTAPDDYRIHSPFHRPFDTNRKPGCRVEPVGFEFHRHMTCGPGS